MNTNSHYRHSIIEKLLKYKKNNNASKSIKSKLEIKQNSNKIPMHISLKTPVLNLTNECSQHEYNIKTTLNTNMDQLPKSADRICICMYRVIHCRNQQNVQMPFLEYLLYKYPESSNKESNLLVFPFIKGGKSVIKSANSFVYKLIDQTIKPEGFIEKNKTVFLFYNYSNNDNSIVKRVFYKTKKNTLWWCLIDEICNYKRVLNFPVHPSVFNIFYRNPALIYLKHKDKRIDTPVIGYYGNYIKFLPMVAALGQKAAITIEGGFEDSFFFGSFRKGIRYGAWSPFYKKMSLFDKEISDIDGLYDKGGIIRFALFMGKTKVLIDSPYDQISDYITGKKSWKNKYQSIFMASTNFDKKNINIPPEYILKNFEQQVPLTYHEIDKKTLKPNWDSTSKTYNIV